MKRASLSALLALALATVIHVDWHLARPAHLHHRLSFGLPYHWLIAIPAFALAAWCVARLWPGRFGAGSAWVLGGAFAASQVLEPLGEQVVYFDRVAPGIEPARWSAFLACAAAGLASYLAAVVLLHACRNARSKVDRPAAVAGG